MDAQELNGMAVVTLAEAQRLGRVEEVLFDTSPLRAIALGVRTDKGQRLVALEDIARVGPDAIVVGDVGVASRAEGDLSGRTLIGLTQLTKLKTVDESGALLGQITHVDLDPARGDVNHFQVRRGDVLGVGGESRTLTPDRIMGIGQELVTVRTLGR